MSVPLLPSHSFERPLRLSDHAYEQLKSLILSNCLLPGESITEERFATQWNISRTPLRAAFVRLERDGFVKLLPHKGCIVTEITPKDVQSVYEVREALEVMAIQLATPCIADEKLREIDDRFRVITQELAMGHYEAYIASDAYFHGSIIESAPNPLLIQMLAGIYDRVTRIRNFSNTQPGEHMRESFAEHVDILAAMRRRDADAAASAMRHHMRNITRRAITLLRESMPLHERMLSP